MGEASTRTEGKEEATMAAERIADMTREELQHLIDEAIDRRLGSLNKPKDTHSIQEINESIRKHRWTPKPGTPSTLELLREDRDR
jgi:hypothetical protein